MKKGFTLVELLVVVAIVGTLSTIIVNTVDRAREKGRYSRAVLEFRSIANALELYYLEYGNYPAETAVGEHPDGPQGGVGKYLAQENHDYWPKGPWSISRYDWENWNDPDTPGAKIYQISLRFCDGGTCNFPDLPWASDFTGIRNALYYCVEGACRPHINEDPDYPGHCVNC